MTLTELQTLRVSVARIAQSLGVDNELRVTGNGYAELCNKARANERGWNNLAGECAWKAQSLREQGEESHENPR